MRDEKTLDECYKILTDQKLLKLRAEGGFTAEAEQVPSRRSKNLSRN
jgi:hypothetical protein